MASFATFIIYMLYVYVLLRYVFMFWSVCIQTSLRIKYPIGMIYAIALYVRPFVCLSVRSFVRLSVYTVAQERLDVK